MVKFKFHMIGLELDIEEHAFPVRQFFHDEEDEAFVPENLFLCVSCGFVGHDKELLCPVCEKDAWIEYVLALLA
jgi:rubrerythrin